MSSTGPSSDALHRAASRLTALPVDLDGLLADLCEALGLDGASLISGTGLDARNVASWGTAQEAMSHHLLPTATHLALHLSGGRPSEGDLSAWIGLLSAAHARAGTSAGDAVDRLHSAGGLLRMLGHDMRNLVGAFDQNLEFAVQSLEEMRPAPPATVFEDLTQVAGASERVMSYVQRIHQLAHILQGPWAPLAPGATFGRVLLSMEEGGAAKGTVRSSVTDGLPELRVDMTHATLIVRELVDNARLAGARHIRLSLGHPADVHPDLVDWATSLPAGDWVAVECEDDGVGMDAFLLTRCVEPLVFHPDASDRSGLGFSMIRSVLRAIGGRLGVVSRAGRGTAVVVALPAADHPAPGPGGGATVVVPDEARVRVAVRLEDAGFARWVVDVLRDIHVTVVDDPRVAEVLIADKAGALAHPGKPCGMFFVGSGWPPGVPRPDAVMMPTPDREGFIRRLSMAVTRSRGR